MRAICLLLIGFIAGITFVFVVGDYSARRHATSGIELYRHHKEERPWL